MVGSFLLKKASDKVFDLENQNDALSRCMAEINSERKTIETLGSFTLFRILKLFCMKFKALY